YNEGGTLMVPTGYVGAIQCDPTEKKPFFHALPGSLALTFGMLGCDYHCSYCQNWVTSQALRDPNAVSPPREVTPGKMVEIAWRLVIERPRHYKNGSLTRILARDRDTFDSRVQ